MTDYSEHINFIKSHSFRPHRNCNWGLFGLILTSGPDSTIMVYEPESNPKNNIWKFVEFAGANCYLAKYVNGIGEVRIFDFSKDKTYKATTRLEAYTPISSIVNDVQTNNYEVDSEEEDSRF